MQATLAAIRVVRTRAAMKATTAPKPMGIKTTYVVSIQHPVDPGICGLGRALRPGLLLAPAFLSQHSKGMATHLHPLLPYAVSTT